MSTTASTVITAPPVAPRRGLNRRYGVWAPRAKRVALAVEDERLPMTGDAHGWWTADREMRDGELYAYVVDDEGPWPDPGACASHRVCTAGHSALPDPQSPETFGRSRLRWDELASPEHAELLRWYRTLIALRRQLPSLRDGNHRAVAVTIEESQRRLSVRRGPVLVACNLGDAPAAFDVGCHHRLVLASDPNVCWLGGAIHLPAESIAVLEHLEADPA